MIWKLLPQLLATALFFAVAILDYKWHDKRTRKFKKLRTSLFWMFPVFQALSIFAVYKDELNSQRQQETLIQHMDVKEALSTDIKNLNVILVFRESIKAEMVSDMSLLFSLSKNYQAVNTWIEVLGYIQPQIDSTNAAKWGLSFFSKFFIEVPHQENRGFSYGAVAWPASIPELPLPISIDPSWDRPFLKVRDLEGFHVQLFLPPQLARAVQRIDVVANSNIGFRKALRLFSKTIAPDDWTEIDYDVTQRFWRKEVVERKKTWTLKNAKVEFRWSIDVEHAEWRINALPQLEGFRRPFRLIAP